MASHGVASMFAVALVLGVFAAIPTAVQSIGVCYGVQGDGLPSASEVVQLYTSNKINAMRIYDPNQDGALAALAGSGIDLIMDIGQGLDVLRNLANNPSAASDWVRDNVQAHPDVSFRYIAVGNEIQGDDRQSILPAMTNINNALTAAGLGNIKVSTAIRMDALVSSSPPSDGAFADASLMGTIVKFLADNGSPLLANVYPYFAYRGNQGIDLNYALFKESSTTVNDNGLTYTNLFDAMVDAVYSAMDKVGGLGVPIVVSESGWPSAGGDGATPDNAKDYNQGLINHVGQGTPKKTGNMEAYIFAMFDENRKGGDETEKHFGLFNGQTPAYNINF